jgi:1-phosphofructokinase
MTASLAVAQARGLGADETLRLAAAAGALNVTRHGLGTGKLDDIEEVAAHVAIRELSPLSHPAA